MAEGEEKKRTYSVVEGLRRVCIPIDGSDHCERAFQWYLLNVRQPQDLVVFIHVMEPPSLPSLKLGKGFKVPHEDWAKTISVQIQASQKMEEDYETTCRGKGLKFEFHNISSKNAGEGVCTAMEERKGDMVIMGNRGVGKIRRTILGSVSDYVLHHSRIPITIVPPFRQHQK